MTTPAANRKQSRKRPESGVGRRADAPRVLVTAGPTHEPIDTVRYIGNRSSGQMGVALAQAAARAGCATTLLLGPTSLTPSDTSIRVRRFRTAADLQALLKTEFPQCDALIMAAAVGDYRPRVSGRQLSAKLPRTGAGLILRLEATPDLVAGVAARRRPGQFVVGFALEPRATLAARARKKLGRKGLDLIVANPLETMDAPDIRAVVIGPAGVVMRTTGRVSKAVFARRLIALVLSIQHAKSRGDRRAR
jgi:phosphopantothenoylcysteine decarboxylase/phosphopantothenate--cysteine ligase